MRTLRFPALLLAALCALGASASAIDLTGTCERSPGLDYLISPGLAGCARTNRWTPVRVRLTNQGEAVRGRLQILHTLSDQSVARYEVPVDLPANSIKAYFLYYVAEGNSETLLRLEREDGRTLFERELLLNSAGSLPVVLVLGIRAYGLPPEIKPPEVKDSPRRMYTAIVLPIDGAPDRWIGYDGADEVLLADPLPSDFRSTACAAALVDWVKAGGHAIFCVGDRWQGVSESVFAPLVPGELTGSATADFAALLPNQGLPAGTLPGVRAVLSGLRGRVLAGTAAVPLVVSHAAGCGRVTFVAFDPGRAPFAGWPGLQAFWEKHAIEAELVSFEPTINNGRTRYYDREYDLASLVENAPVGNRLGTGWLLLTLGLYLLVLGVGDYLLLRRLKRLDWMWLTMAGWVSLFTAACYILSEYGRERNAIVRTVKLVDVSPDGFRSGAGVASLYAPVASTFDLAARIPGFAVSHHQSLYRRNGGGGGLLGDIRGRIVEEEGISLMGMRVHRGMMVTVRTWWEDGASAEILLEAKREGAAVRIRNRTGQVVTQAIVLSKAGKWSAGEIPAGQEILLALDDGKKQALVQPQFSFSYYGDTSVGSDEPAWRNEVLEDVTSFSAADCFFEAKEAVKTKDVNNPYVQRFSTDLVRDLSRDLKEDAIVVLALMTLEGREMSIAGAELRVADATVVRLIVRK